MAFLMLKNPRGTGPREHKFLDSTVLPRAPIQTAHFKEPCHEIDRGVLVGSINAACPEVVAEKRITHIVNPLGEDADSRFKLLRDEHGIRFFTTSFQDNASVQIGRYFKAVNAWVAEALAASPDNNVLVMCAAGVSRSAALACAYLMERRGMRVIDAFTVVQAKRTICDPNPAFRKDLVTFDAHLFEGASWPYEGLSMEELDARADPVAGGISSSSSGSGTGSEGALPAPEAEEDALLAGQLGSKLKLAAGAGAEDANGSLSEGTRLPTPSDASSTSASASAASSSVTPAAAAE